jgi:hypothetical protein
LERRSNEGKKDVRDEGEEEGDETIDRGIVAGPVRPEEPGSSRIIPAFQH